jgi:hypothetical protein
MHKSFWIFLIGSTVSFNALALSAVNCDVQVFSKATQKFTACGTVTLTNAHSYQHGVGPCGEIAVDLSLVKAAKGGETWIVSVGRAINGLNLDEVSSVSFPSNIPSQFSISGNFSNGSGEFDCSSVN